jgi:pyruvate dehydrogenase E1 component alpha subunit
LISVRSQSSGPYGNFARALFRTLPFYVRTIQCLFRFTRIDMIFMTLNDYPPELLVDLYRRMVLIREFELRAIAEREAGLIPGFIHACIGQEAAAVGACAALRSDDVIASTHRGHGHLLAKGGDPRQMMAELAGRTTGYCLGRGGSLHIADLALGSLGANGIVAGGLPMAVGAALAFQMRGEARVALAFFGDGATNQGAFHEALNMAGLWKLPVIFLCENNLYSEGTPQRESAPLSQLSARAASYAFPGITVDGNDVIAVYEAVSRAVESARIGGGPTLIECMTYRWHGHYEGDPQIYKPSGELEQWQQRDPLLMFSRSLQAAGLMDEAQITAIRTLVLAQLHDAVLFARESPHPAPEDALLGVFAAP